jgi:RNase P protein component
MGPEDGQSISQMFRSKTFSAGPSSSKHLIKKMMLTCLIFLLTCPNISGRFLPKSRTGQVKQSGDGVCRNRIRHQSKAVVQEIRQMTTGMAEYDSKIGKGGR